ncbi:MAG TPA: RlpA-like double-psi beta-barrel domain-containing protein [Candidatus Limnocylindrales bacterium]
MANRSAGWLGPDSPLAEFGAPPAVADGRFDAPPPAVAPLTVPKPTPTPSPAPQAATIAPRPAVATTTVSAWHFDPNVSWYGPGMYGSRTACGVTLTTTVLGVANRTLPCGTKVTFRNPANGRTVTVPVIDRGPYVSGRTWDMSGGLCVYLDHCYTGAMEWRLAA